MRRMRAYCLLRANAEFRGTATLRTDYFSGGVVRFTFNRATTCCVGCGNEGRVGVLVYEEALYVPYAVVTTIRAPERKLSTQKPSSVR